MLLFFSNRVILLTYTAVWKPGLDFDVLIMRGLVIFYQIGTR